MTTRLVAERITFGYHPTCDVLRDVSIEVRAGEILFVLGANGSGKTTLLDCLAGLLRPRAGRVLADGEEVERLRPAERARRVGRVPQIHEPVFDYTVEDVVMMGRTPHLGAFSKPRPSDREAVREAMCAVGVGALGERTYTTISGGERQLVLIARGLAQGAGCLLMDEPAAHLDPGHQQAVFGAVARLAGDGFAFVVSSHQPNHALQYADDVALLLDAQIVTEGSPSAVLTPDALERAYGLGFLLFEGAGGTRAVLPRPHVVRSSN